MARKPNPPNSSLTYLGRAANVLLSQSAARNPKAGRTLGERSTFPAGRRVRTPPTPRRPGLPA